MPSQSQSTEAHVDSCRSLILPRLQSHAARSGQSGACETVTSRQCPNTLSLNSLYSRFSFSLTVLPLNLCFMFLLLCFAALFALIRETRRAPSIGSCRRIDVSYREGPCVPVAE